MSALVPSEAAKLTAHAWSRARAAVRAKEAWRHCCRCCTRSDPTTTAAQRNGPTPRCARTHLSTLLLMCDSLASISSTTATALASAAPPPTPPPAAAAPPPPPPPPPSALLPRDSAEVKDPTLPLCAAAEAPPKACDSPPAAARGGSGDAGRGPAGGSTLGSGDAVMKEPPPADARTRATRNLCSCFHGPRGQGRVITCATPKSARERTCRCRAAAAAAGQQLCAWRGRRAEARLLCAGRRRHGGARRRAVAGVRLLLPQRGGGGPGRGGGGGHVVGVPRHRRCAARRACVQRFASVGAPGPRAPDASQAGEPKALVQKHARHLLRCGSLVRSGRLQATIRSTSNHPGSGMHPPVKVVVTCAAAGAAAVAVEVLFPPAAECGEGRARADHESGGALLDSAGSASSSTSSYTSSSSPAASAPTPAPSRPAPPAHPPTPGQRIANTSMPRGHRFQGDVLGQRHEMTSWLRLSGPTTESGSPAAEVAPPACCCCWCRLRRRCAAAARMGMRAGGDACSSSVSTCSPHAGRLGARTQGSAPRITQALGRHARQTMRLGGGGRLVFRLRRSSGSRRCHACCHREADCQQRRLRFVISSALAALVP